MTRGSHRRALAAWYGPCRDQATQGARAEATPGTRRGRSAARSASLGPSARLPKTRRRARAPVKRKSVPAPSLQRSIKRAALVFVVADGADLRRRPRQALDRRRRAAGVARRDLLRAVRLPADAHHVPAPRQPHRLLSVASRRSRLPRVAGRPPSTEPPRRRSRRPPSGARAARRLASWRGSARARLRTVFRTGCRFRLLVRAARRPTGALSRTTASKRP